jgi:hypothetical protein
MIRFVLGFVLGMFVNQVGREMENDEDDDE